DVEKYYNTADVLLSTTESESFYLVMLEASAFGLPAVMYRLPHLPFDKSEGVVSVEVGDVDSAAEEIVRILGDEGLRQRMHEGALACYQQFRTFDYESAWREVLECTPDSGAPKDDGSLDTLAWNILLAHWAHGSERIWEHERQAVEDERLDHEETIEWYLGSKLTALPQKFLDIFAPIK
ncbi:MAG: glycosyltransferase, partial [Eggerthellaceae bacterium]|nr:glycosyltransferase [Eggerthellaceae bacterium]